MPDPAEKGRAGQVVGKLCRAERLPVFYR